MPYSRTNIHLHCLFPSEIRLWFAFPAHATAPLYISSFKSSVKGWVGIITINGTPLPPSHSLTLHTEAPLPQPHILPANTPMWNDLHHPLWLFHWGFTYKGKEENHQAILNDTFVRLQDFTKFCCQMESLCNWFEKRTCPGVCWFLGKTCSKT